MKKIEDYLHLYIPLEGYLKGYPTPMLMTGLTEDKFVIKFSNGNVSMHIQHLSDFKPLLRPLSSMTEDEAEYIGCEYKNGKYNTETITSDCIVSGTHHITEIKSVALVVQYLLSHHFDLFNLIPEGLALDKTKYTNNGTK